MAKAEEAARQKEAEVKARAAREKAQEAEEQSRAAQLLEAEGTELDALCGEEATKIGTAVAADDLDQALVAAPEPDVAAPLPAPWAATLFSTPSSATVALSSAGPGYPLLCARSDLERPCSPSLESLDVAVEVQSEVVDASATDVGQQPPCAVPMEVVVVVVEEEEEDGGFSSPLAFIECMEVDQDMIDAPASPITPREDDEPDEDKLADVASSPAAMDLEERLCEAEARGELRTEIVRFDGKDGERELPTMVRLKQLWASHLPQMVDYYMVNQAFDPRHVRASLWMSLKARAWMARVPTTCARLAARR